MILSPGMEWPGDTGHRSQGFQNGLGPSEEEEYTGRDSRGREGEIDETDPCTNLVSRSKV